jgi:dimethylhistidine N-methyltransferase
MPVAATRALSAFARDVTEGLLARPKKLSPQFLYDDLGSALFEAITLLPEYGLARADERLLQHHAREIAAAAPFATVCELGSGSGRKTRHILQAAPGVLYRPIDISPAALAACARDLGDVAGIEPVLAEWMEGLGIVARERSAAPLLLLFLGSSIGNLDRRDIPPFLSAIQTTLRAGDYFLIGFDLVKEIDRMIEAYDDPTGVTTAFNLNLLGRINRELAGEFDLHSFVHEARWNSHQRRIEMHLLSTRAQQVRIGALDAFFSFDAGETIWTESSHKFFENELHALARTSGFEHLALWIDSEWPFANVLWRVR